MLILTLVLRRLLRNWRMHLALFSGLLLGAVIFSGVPVFSAGVAAQGLRQSLETAEPAEKHILVSAEPDELTAALYGLIREDLGPLLRERVEVRDAEGTGKHALPVPVGPEDRRLNLLTIPNPGSYLEVLEGELPSANTLLFNGFGCSVVNEAARDYALPEYTPEQPAPFEFEILPSYIIPAAVAPEVAADLGLSPGDLVPLGRTLPAAFQITAIARPSDPTHRVWGGHNRLYLGPGQALGTEYAGGLLVTAEDYFCFAGSIDRPLHYWWLSGQAGHLTVLEGRLPSDPPLPELNQLDFFFEAALGAESLEQAPFQVGDRLELAERTYLDIVGIVAPADAEEDLWLGDMRPFRGELRGGLNAQTTSAPLFVTEGTLGALNPVHFSVWRLLVNTDSISYASAGETSLRLSALSARVAGLGAKATLSTGLDDIINRFFRVLVAVRVPLFLLAAEVLALTLYTLALVASLALERAQGEMAVLSSRGGSVGQVVLLAALEAVVLSAPAALLAPRISAWLATVVGGGEALEARTGLEALALASIAAGLGALALSLPAFPLARRSLIAWKLALSRPEGRAAWHRLYIDLFLLALGGLAFWQLAQSGSFLARRFSGSPIADLLLLASPTLVLLATALLFLRLFPLLAGLLARLVHPTRSLALSMGLARLARSPVGPSRVILLVTLAGALALFSTAFGHSLEVSQADAARNITGADLRLSLEGQDISAMAIEGVMTTALAHRATLFQPGTSRSVELLAVDRVAFESLAGGSYSPFLQAITPSEPEERGLAIPADAQSLGLWIKDERAGDRLGVTLKLRVRDSCGRRLYLSLPRPDANRTDWQFLSVGLPAATSGRAVEGPLFLEGMTITSARSNPPPSASKPHLTGFLLDDISLDAELPPLESFETSAWASGEPGGNSRLALDTASEARTGERSLSLEMRFLDHLDVILGTRALTEEPIPALVSTEFIQGSRLGVGEVFSVTAPGRRLILEARAIVSEFPTLTGRFIVADLDSYAAALDRFAPRPVAPEEAWLEMSEQGYRSFLDQDPTTFRVLADSRALLSEFRSDALAAGLLRGFQGAAILAGLLSAAGFLIHQYLTAGRRVIEYGILRSLGVSAGQLLGLLSWEGLLMIVLGLCAGLALGAVLAFGLRPYLSLGLEATGRGSAQQVTLDWLAVGKVYAALLLVFLLATWLTLAALLRAGVHRVLRLGEE